MGIHLEKTPLHKNIFSLVFMIFLPLFLFIVFLNNWLQMGIEGMKKWNFYEYPEGKVTYWILFIAFIPLNALGFLAGLALETFGI